MVKLAALAQLGQLVWLSSGNSKNYLHHQCHWVIKQCDQQIN